MIPLAQGKGNATRLRQGGINDTKRIRFLSGTWP
jgi:hypothetical protein